MGDNGQVVENGGPTEMGPVGGGRHDPGGAAGSEIDTRTGGRRWRRATGRWR
jgi:hypothetical protein